MKTFLSKYLLLVLLFSMQGFGISVCAQAADKLPTSTSDGRAFTALTEKEVDALPRPEKKAYYVWKYSELDAEYNKQKARADEAQQRRMDAEKRADEYSKLSARIEKNTRNINYITALYQINNNTSKQTVMSIINSMHSDNEIHEMYIKYDVLKTIYSLF